MSGEVPLRPTPSQLALLSSFERQAFTLVDFVNRTPATKAAADAFLRTFGASWVYHCTRNLVHLVGLDELRALRPPRGLLLACNHRSFFDLYVVSCWLYRTTELLQRVYFPVRSDFFYEQPAGVLVNLAMSALAMYPPIFRDAHKREFNSYGVRRVVQLLREPGSVVGVHPEGRRNRTGDPYALLPAQPGVGKLILDAEPTVLPVFINGLGNDLARQVRGNFDGTGEPVIIVLGRPVEPETFHAQRNSLRAQKAVADRVIEEIGRLGEVERALRARLGARPARGPVFHPLPEESEPPRRSVVGG
ncbi:MAG: 1-acyl-sn-glycerol-3-phosphate acyltransferase [Deltaproteobacteria bacterium]|nr:1-acyl-sn-glycerol-3-phosphate acyltransferase [Deltaproteobacteria bacterium]